MSKLSKFFADLSAACNEQANATFAKINEETAAEQALKIKRSANNLARSAGINSASTSHAEELAALSKLAEDKQVAALFRECKISAENIAALAKYNKAKVNATFAKIAQNIVPDWTKNDENAFAFFELMRKNSVDSITLQQIQRMLDHKTLTQASYISNLWRALGVASESGRGNDRTLKVNRDSLLAQRIAALYALKWSAAQQDSAAASA